MVFRKMAVVLAGSAALLGVCISQAEAKRVYYKVNGHPYWYNSKNGPPARIETARAAKPGPATAPTAAPASAQPGNATAVQTALDGIFQGKAQPGAAPAASPPQPAPAAQPAQVAESPASTSESRKSRRPRAAWSSERATRIRGRVAAATIPIVAATSSAVAAAHPAEPARLEAASVEVVPEATPASPAAPPAASAAFTMPLPPPGPTLVNTVTYDFSKGIKTTSLRDGATFIERFDPQAFFRVPTTTEVATSETPAVDRP